MNSFSLFIACSELIYIKKLNQKNDKTKQKILNENRKSLTDSSQIQDKSCEYSEMGRYRE